MISILYRSQHTYIDFASFIEGSIEVPDPISCTSFKYMLTKRKKGICLFFLDHMNTDDIS